MSAPSVNIEFVSAYPSQPLSGDDAYAAIIGDVLARQRAAQGARVTREYLVNDQGPQADALARGVFTRIALPEAVGDDPITRLAQDVRKALGSAVFQAPEAEWMPPIRQAAIDLAMDKTRKELADIGVAFDRFTHESSLDSPAALIEELREMGHVIEEDGQLLNTPAAGDTQPRALTQDNGRYTYFAHDLTYHAGKLARGYDQLITVFRKDHEAYAPGIVAGVALLSGQSRQVETPILGALRPIEGHTHIPTLRELLEGATPTQLRHLFLAHDPSTTLVFSSTVFQNAQKAEREQAQALDLPQTAEGSTVTAPPREPQALYARARHIARAALAEGQISPAHHKELTSLRLIAGLQAE